MGSKNVERSKLSTLVHPIIMIGSKRRHEGSKVSTSGYRGRKESRSPSLDASSPFVRTQQKTQLPQQPAKHLSLHPSRSQLSSRSNSAQHRSVHESDRAQFVSSSVETFVRPESAAAIAEREGADSLNEVIMCIDMRNKGAIGCCYYVARDQKLFVMADVSHGGIEVIEICLLHLVLYIVKPRLTPTSKIANPTNSSDTLDPS